MNKVLSGNEVVNYLLQSSNNDFYKKFNEEIQSVIKNVKNNFPSVNITVSGGEGVFSDCREIKIDSSEEDKHSLKEFIINSYINI